MAERVFYSLAQTAEMLGVHYETVARWVRSGKLPGVKLSRRKVVVPKENLDAFLASRPAERPLEPVYEPGSARRWLAWAGTLTPEEAEFIRATVREGRQIEDDK